MLRRFLTGVIALAWLWLATIGVYRYGWTKWTTPDAARFPDTVFCDAQFAPFFDACRVPSDVAYGLALTTTVLLGLGLLSAITRRRGHRGRLAETANAVPLVRERH